MTEQQPDPSVFEEVFMKCLFSLNKGDIEITIPLDQVVDCFIEKVGVKKEDVNIEKLFTRLTKEGFIEQVSPGEVKMMNCGNLDFSEEFSE